MYIKIYINAWHSHISFYGKSAFLFCRFFFGSKILVFPWFIYVVLYTEKFWSAVFTTKVHFGKVKFEDDDDFFFLQWNCVFLPFAGWAIQCFHSFHHPFNVELVVHLFQQKEKKNVEFFCKRKKIIIIGFSASL